MIKPTSTTSEPEPRSPAARCFSDDTVPSFTEARWSTSPGRGRAGLRLRLALAARIAHLNNADNLATAYREKLGGSRFADIADPTKANTHTDLAACLAFTDQVATRPSAITAADIQNLQDAGIADADIVRLTELNAFLAYQIRLDAGLALMAGASS